MFRSCSVPCRCLSFTAVLFFSSDPLPKRAETGPAFSIQSRAFRKEYVISAKIFVGNLNFNTSRTELETLFAGAGEVVDVVIPSDRDTGRPRGFAFIEFATDEQAAEAATRFNGHELGGRELRVNEATDKPQRSFSDAPRQSFSYPSRGGGGGGAGGGGGDKGYKPKGSRRGMRGKKRSL